MPLEDSLIERLSDAERAHLVDLAHRAVEARVRRQSPPSAEPFGALVAPRAAFVSLHRSGELRGCLGRLEPDLSLGQLVVELAFAVADSDPRFEPVAPHELADLAVQVSVLTPSREIRSAHEVEVGTHGLIVEQGRHRGLLLPQVAVEYRWTRETFLEHTCRKAGLSADAWKRGARLWVFEADVFGD